MPIFYWGGRGWDNDESGISIKSIEDLQLQLLVDGLVDGLSDVQLVAISAEELGVTETAVQQEEIVHQEADVQVAL